MKLIKKSNLASIIFFLAILLLFAACSEDETALTPGNSPTVPPQSSMAVDFNEFPDTNSPGPLFKFEPSDTVFRGNWGWAAWHVGVWSTLIKIGLAIPVAAFAESFNHQPVQQPDG